MDRSRCLYQSHGQTRRMPCCHRQLLDSDRSFWVWLRPRTLRNCWPLHTYCSYTLPCTSGHYLSSCRTQIADSDQHCSVPGMFRTLAMSHAIFYSSYRTWPISCPSDGDLVRILRGTWRQSRQLIQRRTAWQVRGMPPIVLGRQRRWQLQVVRQQRALDFFKSVTPFKTKCL